MARISFVTAALAASTLLAAPPPAAPETATMAKFTLSSTDLTEGGRIGEAQVFNEFGCKGGNVSPALSWSGAPAGTQSFALLVHDPDAPTGSGWWHWVVYNIPASTTSLPAGAGDPKKKLMPAGAVQGRTDYGTVGYGGPCPPPGKPHHYHFQLYALKVAKLDLPADASPAMVGFNARAQALGNAEIVALYGR
ncbi:MAG TPA: YbhB/YbcL family Raf kinase inhibitor-like protein [Steroidobacteraceae bacterium]|nr:YbhB/YbcL family Raf kinase inhibitor-like protein [Steroidobacteraceae bacterium]